MSKPVISFEGGEYRFLIPRMHAFLIAVWPDDDFVRMMLSLHHQADEFDDLKRKHLALDATGKKCLALCIYESCLQDGEADMAEAVREATGLSLNQASPRKMRKRTNKYRRPL